MAKLWLSDPTKTCIRIVGRDKATKAQNRRLAFAKEVLPYILSRTMHHKIVPVNFSKSSCEVLIPKRNCPRAGFSKGISLHSQKDIDEWIGDWTGWEKGASIKSLGKFRKCGTSVMNRGLMTIFFEPNMTEETILGVFDIDIGKGRTEKESRPIIVRIVELLRKMGLFSLVMWTGKSWQVWFKRPDNKSMGNYQRVRDEIIFPVAKQIRGLWISKTIKRAPEGKISVDYSVNARRRLLRFFFSQHASPGGKTHTGKVSIPVRTSRVMKFKPIESHPVKVEKKLKEYMKMIDDFLPFGKEVKRMKKVQPERGWAKVEGIKEKLIEKISKKFGYSKAEVREAVVQFKEEVDTGETTLGDLQRDMQRLLLLSYPKLKAKLEKIEYSHKKWPKAMEITISSVKRPVRIKTTEREHPDQKLAHAWKNYRGTWPDLTFPEAQKFYQKKKGIVVTVKADGELECLHFARNGVKVMGFDTKTHKSVQGTKVKCLMANHGSHIYINNPITESFAKYCEGNGIEEAILFGEAFGMRQSAMLPFPPRIPGTSTSILASDDWSAWEKYIKFWAFDLYEIGGKRYFPKVKYKDRLKKLKELFGMAEAISTVRENRAKVLENGEVLKEIDRRLEEGTKMRLSEDKSHDGVIRDTKKWLWNGFIVSFHRPEDYLDIFEFIAETISRLPEFSRESFGMTDVFMVEEKKEPGRYLIVPIPRDIKLRKKRLREYIKRRPWVYTLGKKTKNRRVKENALTSFRKYLKITKDKKLKGRAITTEKVRRPIYRLKVIKIKKSPEVEESIEKAKKEE